MKNSLLALYLFIVIATLSFCSDKTIPTQENYKTNCYSLLTKISDFWKMDSLANNGYRYEIVRNYSFINCASIGIPKDTLIKFLGPPDKVDTSGNNENYFLKYYYLNTLNIPKNNILLGGYRIIHYISFMQDTSNITKQVSIGHYDF